MLYFAFDLAGLVCFEEEEEESALEQRVDMESGRAPWQREGRAWQSQLEQSTWRLVGERTSECERMLEAESRAL